MAITVSLPASIFSAAVPRRRVTTATVPVTIYDDHWRTTTQRIRHVLDRAGVLYQYVDLQMHPDAEHELRIVAGADVRMPVVYVDGEWLMAPTPSQVEDALERHGVIINHSGSPREAIKRSGRTAFDRLLSPANWQGFVHR